MSKLVICEYHKQCKDEICVHSIPHTRDSGCCLRCGRASYKKFGKCCPDCIDQQQDWDTAEN